MQGDRLKGQPAKNVYIRIMSRFLSPNTIIQKKTVFYENTTPNEEILLSVVISMFAIPPLQMQCEFGYRFTMSGNSIVNLHYLSKQSRNEEIAYQDILMPVGFEQSLYDYQRILTRKTSVIIYSYLALAVVLVGNKDLFKA